MGAVFTHAPIEPQAVAVGLVGLQVAVRVARIHEFAERVSQLTAWGPAAWKQQGELGADHPLRGAIGMFDKVV